MTDLVPVEHLPAPDDERWQAELLLVGQWLDNHEGNTHASYANAIGWPQEPRTGEERDTAQLRAGVSWLRWCQDRGLSLFGVHRPEMDRWVAAINAAPLSRSSRLQMVRAVSSFYGWACQRGHTEVNPVALIDQRSAVV